uniref:Membrane-associated ring finger (C3HC4) 4 n=1 Tax=Cyprinus carpio TaxID=7962 RepID=A0A8C2QAC2_CYPCA
EGCNCCGIQWRSSQPKNEQGVHTPAMLKSRCCVLFSDLKVFLLGPQAPTNPMSGQTARISPFASDNNNTLRAHRLRHWSIPSTEDSEAAADGSWSGAAVEEFPKDRRDDRFSFISYAEGTPVCRICFQGPEQVETNPTHMLVRYVLKQGCWFKMVLTTSQGPAQTSSNQQPCFKTFLTSISLIVHEGPSVFRIFHRWQAVNQQWKVLNYDKKRDSEEQKNNEEWTPAAQDSYQTDALADGPALPDQHCPYNLLHLLSHLRPHEPRSPASNISTNTTKPREVVMRVTTV